MLDADRVKRREKVKSKIKSDEQLIREEKAKMRLKQQFILSDITVLSERKERAIIRLEKEKTTIANLNRKIIQKKASGGFLFNITKK